MHMLGASSIRLVSQASGSSNAMLDGIVTKDMLNGVLSEIVGLLPVCIPVMISYIALRKGIAFVQGVLHSA